MAFVEHNHQIVSGIYNTKNNFKTWKGFRLCAIDGTSIRLPNKKVVYEGVNHILVVSVFSPQLL